MIMGRNPKFNIAYAQIIEPIEKAFFQLPEVANGKDHHAMGEMFTNMAERCRQFVENDMSKYESSQRWTTLKLEYVVYYKVLSKMQPGLLPLLRMLYSACLRNKVKTSLGVALAFILCRVSGDLTTSLGNGLVNLVTTQYGQVKNSCDSAKCGLDTCERPGCRVRDVIVKGDDSVLGRNPNTSYTDYYRAFGLDAKIVLRDTADSVEFCSGGFVDVGSGKYVYVQKLQKLIESLTTCINQDALRCGWVAHYYKSLGLMYKVVYRGIPIYEDIADFLLSTNVEFGVNINLVSSYNLLDAYAATHMHTEVDISTATLGIALVNNMDYAELSRIQTWMRTHTLCLPDNMRKRCNQKTFTSDVVPTINFEEINSQILESRLDRDLYKLQSKLMAAEKQFA